MAARKACIVYTEAKSAEADVVADRLKGQGFNPCLAKVTVEDAMAVKAGDASSLPRAVQDCLNGAQVCILLIEDESTLGGIGGLASDAGCRVITVRGDPGDLTQDLDDLIDGHIPSPNSPELIDVVEGAQERVLPDGSSAPPRNPDRVKCQ